MTSNFPYRSTIDLPNTIPVFPLDHALLLPKTILPLNIFEPRYVAMIDHALKTDRIIGMIQTDQNNSVAKGDVSLLKIGCAGRITQFTETGDGRYLVTLSGTSRYEIENEIDAKFPFRICSVNFQLFEHDLLEPPAIPETTRIILIDTFKYIAEKHNLNVNWEDISKTTDSNLVNGMSMLQFFTLDEKQALLEAKDVSNRADLLIAITEVRNTSPSEAKTTLQ